MPRPLKTLRYCPAKAVWTKPRVFNSRWRIFLKISRGSCIALRFARNDPSRLWNGQPRKYFFDDYLTRDFFRFRLIADYDPMSQHIRADAFHILRRNVATTREERAG